MSRATRNYSIRLSAEGKRQLEADLRALGASGERSLKMIQGAARPASAGLQATDRSARELRGSLNAVGRELPALQRLAGFLGTTALAGGLVAFGRSSLDVAGQFQAAMKRVEAATRAPEDAIERLKRAALDTGATTAFTARDAADAIEVLAKNGLDVAEILGGALTATVNLAGGLGAELAPAGDLVTDIMQQFGLAAADLPQVVDAVTGAALNSKFGFDDLRLAIGQAGGVAGQFGGDYREFLTALAATASGFASGSDAGTSFKNFLQRLTPQSKEAAAAMRELDLDFYTETGSLKSMVEIVGELEAATAGLSEEARNSAFQTIFGTDAIRTALLLAETGAAGFRDMADAIGDVSAQEQAEVRLQGLEGALKEVAAAWEAVQLASSDAGGLDVAEGAVRRLTEAFRYVAENFEEVEEIAERVSQALVTYLVGRGVTLAIAKGLAMRAAYIELSGAVTGAGTAASRSVGPLTRLGVAARVFTGVLGGPLSLAITAASLASLAIDFDSASDAIERADSAAMEGARALEAYETASKKAAEEQERLGGAVSSATKEMLKQSKAQMQQALSDARRAYGDAMSSLSGSFWDDDGIDDFERRIRALFRTNLQTGAPMDGVPSNAYLTRLADLAAAFQDGEIGIAQFAAEFDALRAVGDELATLRERMLDIVEAGGDLFGNDDLKRIREVAAATGLFDEELQALEDATHPGDMVVAFFELAEAMRQASEAGVYLRSEGLGDFRENIAGAVRTAEAVTDLEKEVARVSEGYEGLRDLGVEIDGQRPFDGARESAEEAVESVDRLTDAYKRYREAGAEGYWQTDRGAYQRAEAEIAGKGILDLIGFVEGTDKGRGYNETLGYGAFTGGPVNLVNMTLEEVRALQRQMLRHPDNTYNSSAVGRYQIVGRTLQGLMQRLNLSGDELFSADLQDRLAMELVRGRMGQGKSGFYAEWEGFKKAGTPWSTIQTALGQEAIPRIDPKVSEARQEAARERAEAQKEDARERAQAQKEEAETLARLVAVGDEQIAQLELEASLAGKSAREQVRLRTMFELLTAAKQAGIDPEKQLAADGRKLIDVYREQANAIAARTTAQEQSREASDAERQSFDEAKDAVQSAFDNLKPGGDGPMAFIDDLTSYMANKLWELALDPIWDMIAQLLSDLVSGFASGFGAPAGSSPAPAAAPARAGGGEIPNFAGGGDVARRAAGFLAGAGGKRQDNLLFWGSPGEFMQPAASVDYYGRDFMEAVRRRRFPKFADGGALFGANAGPSGGGAPALQMPSITFIDQSGRGLGVEQRESVGPRGQRSMEFVFSDAVAGAMTLPGGRPRQFLMQQTNVKPRRTRR